MGNPKVAADWPSAAQQAASLRYESAGRTFAVAQIVNLL
jgi:hypothetical protein